MNDVNFVFLMTDEVTSNSHECLRDSSQVRSQNNLISSYCTWFVYFFNMAAIAIALSLFYIFKSLIVDFAVINI